MSIEAGRARSGALHDLSRYFSTEVINAITTVGGVAIFTRLVEPAGYGQYALTIAASGIVMAIAGEWLQASALRLVPGLEGSQRSAAIVAARSLAIITALTIAIGTAIAAIVAPDRQLALLVLAGGLYASMSVVFLPVTVLFQATLRPGWYAQLRSSFSILRVACAVLLVIVFGRTPAALMSGSVAALVILLPLGIFRLHGTIGETVASELADARRSFLGFGLPLIGWYAASQTLNLSDRFFLQASRGSFDVGLYSVTYSLAMGVVGGIMQPLLSTAAPLIVHAWQVEGEAAARRRLRSALRALVLVGPLVVTGLGMFGPSLLRVLAPARYETSGLLAAVLGAGILLWFVGLFLQKELELRLDSRRLLLNLVCAASVDLVANSLLIPRYGLMGAAVATVIGYGSYVSLTIIAGWRRLPAIPARTIGAALTATLVFMLVTVLALRIEPLRNASAQILIVGPLALLGFLSSLVFTGELGDLHRDVRASAPGG